MAKAESKQRPHFVDCLWESQQRKTADQPLLTWKLVECCGLDDDGQPVTSTKYPYGDDCGPRDFWLGRWEEGELVPIPGRAATRWSMEQGITLLGLTPHNRCVEVPDLTVLCKTPNWWVVVRNGHELHVGTVKAAEALLWPGQPSQWT